MFRTIRGNLFVAAQLCWLAQPGAAFAQNPDYHPRDFTQPVTVTRGSVAPIGQNGYYLTHEETCTLVVKEFGWQPGSCDGVEFFVGSPSPAIDSLVVRKPVSDGYVKIDDWKADDLSENIEEITQSYKEAMKAQSESLGVPIVFTGWTVYPTVDDAAKTMYYASSATWDGQKNVNIALSIFDRLGYVEIDIVPTAAEIGGAEIETLVRDVAGMYKPGAGSTYAEFSEGDKVAGYGALGVLAGLLGVKFGKAATFGFLAVGLVFLKKFWFIVLLPLVALGRLFRRKGTGEG